jgi:uncharacterized OsmC-like protein
LAVPGGPGELRRDVRGDAAAQLGLSAEGLRVDVDSQSNDRGILGIDDSVPPGPLHVRIRVSGLSLEEDQIRDIAEWAVAHCPVSDAVRRAVPMIVDFARDEAGSH